jgi:hypothetical protein
MSAVLITGCAGAGKSAIAEVLARWGLACIDDDEDPFLARFVDSAGAVVAQEPAQPDFAWLSRHSWQWNPARLDDLIRATAPATLYLCGGAGNQLELADRFTRVFLLEIDEPAMLARLDTRQDNEWGRAGDSREYIRRRLPGYQDRLRASGAIPIDAPQPSTRWQPRYSPARRPSLPPAKPACQAPLRGKRPVTWRARRDSNPQPSESVDTCIAFSVVRISSRSLYDSRQLVRTRPPGV